MYAMMRVKTVSGSRIAMRRMAAWDTSSILMQSRPCTHGPGVPFVTAGWAESAPNSRSVPWTRQISHPPHVRARVPSHVPVYDAPLPAVAAP